METKKYFTLETILQRVKNILDQYVEGKYFWIKAEISTIKSDRNGHYYLELVESAQQRIIAKCRATIWRTQAQAIEDNLGSDAAQILAQGSEILCYCSISFHEIHGFQLTLYDIDLSFSMGEMERKKQENLKRLVAEGLLQRNKTVFCPQVLQRIAVIGSPKTAGHEDFLKQLERNIHGISFQITTFECNVQGIKAASEITSQIRNIPNDDFDVVVLIRGGGSKFDLDVFNDFELAAAIALCQLPVFTGIGHETDSTVVDFVAYQYFKTPSAVAAFIVEKNVGFMQRIQNTHTRILEVYHEMIYRIQSELAKTVNQIKQLSLRLSQDENTRLQSNSNKLVGIIREDLYSNRQFLQTFEENLNFYGLSNIQRRQSKLADQIKLVEIFSKQHLLQERMNFENANEMLFFQLKNLLKKEEIRLEHIKQVLGENEIQKILNRGFVIVRKSGELIQNTDQFEKGDEINIETEDKTIILTIEKAEILWKNN